MPGLEVQPEEIDRMNHRPNLDSWTLRRRPREESVDLDRLLKERLDHFRRHALTAVSSCIS